MPETYTSNVPDGSAGEGSRPAPPARPRRWRRLLARLLFWTVILLPLSAGVLVHLEPTRMAVSRVLLMTPLPFVWMASSADNPLCSWRHATAGLREYYSTWAAMQSLDKTSRLVRTDPQGLQLWDTPLGPWWYPGGASEESIRFSLAQYQLSAYPGLPIRRGDVVLDCGGFVGDWAHWALRAGAARVIVFEPAAGQIECIRRNLAGPLQDGRAVLIPKGVWDRDEQLLLSHWDDNPAGHSVVDQRGPGGETIQLTTIDAVVRELGLQRLDVIKMDIEGAEARALRGARDTLARFRPRLAVATEHTPDVMQNNRDVIAALHEVAPFYTYRCGFCRLDNKDRILPETLYFDPR